MQITQMWKELVMLALVILVALLIANARQGTPAEPVYEPEPEPEPEAAVYDIPWESPPGLVHCQITSYTSSYRETDSDPHINATMRTPIAGLSCAVSRDLIAWLGGWIYIEGLGVFRVDDVMNARHRQSVDLYKGTTEEAMQFGLDYQPVVFLGRE